MELSTGLLFLAAVIVFLVVIFRQNKKFKAMLEYIYADESKGKLKSEIAPADEEEFEDIYAEFTDWVRREVDTQTGETSVKFTMGEIRKKNNEDFQLDMFYRFLHEDEGKYEELEAAVDRLVEERGIYRG